MSQNLPDTWHEANQHYLMEAIGEIRVSLQKALGLAEDDEQSGGVDPEAEQKTGDEASSRRIGRLRSTPCARRSICRASNARFC